jgi:phosphonate transport system substrate-binding protein
MMPIAEVPMKRRHASLFRLALVTAAVAAIAACRESPPLGSEENPLIWAFVPSSETQKVSAGARSAAAMLSRKTGLAIETTVATAYAGVIEALAARPPKVHMSSLATFAYILAADRGAAEAALVAVRHGSPTYKGQIIARRDAGIRTIGDLKGKTLARPDPLSTSGWVIPMLAMRAAGISPERDLREIVDVGSHDAVVAAVYAGDVDAGSTYVDARATLKDRYPDVEEKVLVVAVTAEIPNDGVQFAPSVPAAIRQRIVRALLEIAATDAGKNALYSSYEWEGLEEHDDSFYDPFRQALQASGLGVEKLER